MSSESKNIALVRYMVTEVQQNGNFDLIDKCVSKNWLDHNEIPGHEGVHAVMRYLHQAMSDIKIDIQSCVCTGDMVATNKVLSGKHVGDLFGQAATHERVQFRVMDFIRVQDDKLVEHWACPGPVTPVSGLV